MVCLYCLQNIKQSWQSMFNKFYNWIFGLFTVIVNQTSTYHTSNNKTTSVAIVKCQCCIREDILTGILQVDTKTTLLRTQPVLSSVARNISCLTITRKTRKSSCGTVLARNLCSLLQNRLSLLLSDLWHSYVCHSIQCLGFGTQFVQNKWPKWYSG